MQITNATEIRKNWSETCDTIRNKPIVFNRTHDRMFASSVSNMLQILSNINFKCTAYKEDDGSYTVVSDSMDLAENAKDKTTAIYALAAAILDYSEEYFDNYELYSKAPNRVSHIPFVTKAYLLNSAEKIKGEMVCRNGAS